MGRLVEEIRGLEPGKSELVELVSTLCVRYVPQSIRLTNVVYCRLDRGVAI